MVRNHQPGQAVFRSILPEDIEWKPFPAFPTSGRLAVVVGQPSEQAAELATALRRAAAAHGGHEKRTGEHDVSWPDWYAEYIVREQAGEPRPS